MRFFEGGGLCNYQEYTAGEASRQMEVGLVVDELYMLMLALRTGGGQRRAAKIPTKVLGIVLPTVRMALLNSDLQQVVPSFEGSFADGYWIDAPEIITSVEENLVIAGYLKDYNDPIDDGLARLCAEATLVG